MMIRALILSAAVLMIQVPKAQTACNVQTKYGGDGVAIKYITPTAIDSAADYKTSIGMEFNGSYNYIRIMLSFKTAVKKVVGDLTIQFANDLTYIYVPLVNCTTSEVQGKQVTSCNYIVLDKYVTALKTKTIGTVVFGLSDKTFKAIDLKQQNAILKNAISCLNP
jgi:hypothetical protein